ncbi:MAG: 8-amino-7-oxononanoate synthase [Proteobacteria bacterium]|nr:MAG: 8-amino-7-oxononanoate synthase [Pseudomonadota bacterium]
MQGSGIDILEDIFSRKLAEIKSQGRWRSLRPLTFESSGGALLDLTHNDYLGFRGDPAFQADALQAASAWPMGAGASRLLGGEHKIYGDVERIFSEWKGAESALYFSSGYAANEALMSALAHPELTFFSDSLNHASLIDGLRLARISPQQKVIFQHNDSDDLRSKLAASGSRGKIVVTESLFSMDGDRAPLAKLLTVCEEFGATLVVDEAHALGVYGTDGAGFVSGPEHRGIISVNPCGKAMAASGAFVCGPVWLRNLLINTGRSFIYSTGASPWLAAGIIPAIDHVRKAKVKRVRLDMLGHSLRDHLEELGLSYGESSTHIVPLILGSEENALRFEGALRDRRIFARAIRPPTVPVDQCRLRLSLNSNLANLDPLVLALKELV